jgi:hypothetical protein
MARRSISDTTPQKRIEAARVRQGRDAVVADCVAVLQGGTDPGILRYLAGPGVEKFFDGKEHHDTYWFRVWALRGLLWCFDVSASGHVCAALTDDSWRVREMAAKVVAKHLVGDATAAVATLRDDPIPRVRQAAERALIRLGTTGA